MWTTFHCMNLIHGGDDMQHISGSRLCSGWRREKIQLTACSAGAWTTEDEARYRACVSTDGGLRGRRCLPGGHHHLPKVTIVGSTSATMTVPLPKARWDRGSDCTRRTGMNSQVQKSMTASPTDGRDRDPCTATTHPLWCVRGSRVARRKRAGPCVLVTALVFLIWPSWPV